MMTVLASLGRAATSTIAVAGQKRKQSNESEHRNAINDAASVLESKRDHEETKQTGEDAARGEAGASDSKDGEPHNGATAASVDTEEKKQREKPPKRQKKENATTKQKEKNGKEEKEGQEEKTEEKVDSTRKAGKGSRDKRRVVATATESSSKRLDKNKGEGDRKEEPVQLDDHDMVPAGETHPLHPRVLEFLPLKGDTARLRRAHTEADGSCMLNGFLMGMANGVHPTSDAVQTLRRRLKGMIEGLTKEAWASLGEHDGQCSTPQQYTQRFLSQPDAFLDRSILHFCLQLEDARPPHPLPSLVYCITVQPLFPDAQVEESDDISVRILNKADTAIRVHRYGQQPTSVSAPADCIVLYQQWGATVSKHVELVVHNDPPLARFPHDHPFIVALDKHVSTRSDQIDFARNNSFVCTPLQGWTFPCLLDVDFLPAPSSSTHGSPTYSKLPVVQRILTTVRRDLDRSDRRFLRYLVALSHISQMRNADKREEEYNKIVFFVDEYEPCNMPIVLGCIVISFFIYATPHVGKWFHAQKRVTLKMLASCPAPLVRDEYRLNLLFLHLMHSKAMMKRDDITTLATQLIAEDDIPTKGGWGIDEKTYEFTFHVIHTTGKVKEDERVLKHERAWWAQSKLQEDKHWKEVVETTIKAVRLLTIKELGGKVRRGSDGGQDKLHVLITGDPQHPRWWTRDQILRHKIKQWKEKLDEFEAQTEEKAEDEEKAQPAVDKDRVIQQLRAEIAKEKAAYENEKIKREKAEHALKKRVEKEREQVNKAKEALAAERDEIEKRKQQLDKQQAKINDWLRDHPEAANVVGV